MNHALQKIGVFALFVLLTIGMTWPVAARLSTHLPGEGGDLWVHQWNFWWLKKAVFQGKSPFYTQQIFYPYGTELVYHNFAWAHFFAWLPLQAIAGPIAAYGFVILLVFALGGYAMFLLARRVTGDPMAGFVAGIVYTFWPYAQSHFDHPNLKAMPWFPLLFICLDDLLRKKRRRDLLQLALVIALIGVTRWQLLTFAGIIVALYVAYQWLTRPAVRSWENVLRLGLAGLIALLMMLPLIAPLLFDIARNGLPSEAMLDEQQWGQTDLLAYALPIRYHPVWGDAVWPLYDNLIVNKVYMAFIGYTAAALAVFGLIHARRRALFWGLFALTIFFLALGPVLRINGKLIEGLPMPYRLVGRFFFIRILRKPDRFNVILGLPLGMLASWGIVGLRRQASSRLVSDAIAVVLAALVLFEYLIHPFPTVRPTVPRWYETLRDEPGQFAILDLPIDPVMCDKKYMSYQLVHSKPLVGGKISRLTSETLRFIEERPFLRKLYHKKKMDASLKDVSRQLGYLAEHNIRYLVLHKEDATPEQLAQWRDWLTIEPAHEDERLVIYRTDPLLGRDFQLQQRVSSSLGMIRATVKPTSTTQGGLLTVDARWGSAAPVTRNLDVQLSVITDAGETVQSIQLPLSEDWPTDQWSSDAVVRAEYPFQLDPFTPPGDSSLQLTIVSPAGEPLGAPIKIASVIVKSLPRSFKRPAMEHDLDVNFGDQLSLLGYDLTQDSEKALLTLHWRAQRRMEIPYKFFVHLYDGQDHLVRQKDFMPRDWTYLTTWWEKDEVVSDDISFSLEDLPPGEYRLGVGVYHPDTGARLPVQSASADLGSDKDQLLLPEEVTW